MDKVRIKHAKWCFAEVCEVSKMLSSDETRISLKDSLCGRKCLKNRYDFQYYSLSLKIQFK